MRNFSLTSLIIVLALPWLAQALTNSDSTLRRQKITQEIEALYVPLVLAQGGDLEIQLELENDYLVASATRNERQWIVKISGGFLQSSRLTDDAYRIVLCHELGHLLGGAPLRPVPPEWDGPTDGHGNMLLSAEGQADYYSSLDCMKRVLSHPTTIPYDPQNSVANPVVVEKCSAQYEDDELNLICQRSAMAGFSSLRAVKDFAIAFETPSQTVVEETITHIYPDRQCRLDTILEGALGHARPACWFRH